MTRRMVGNATRRAAPDAIRPGSPVHRWPVVCAFSWCAPVSLHTVAAGGCHACTLRVRELQPCPSAPVRRGCERRTHVARRLTGPLGTGRARRGRRSRLRRLRPDLPALRMGHDQQARRPAEGRRRRVRRQPDATAGRAGPRPAAARPGQRRHPGALQRHFGVRLAFQNCHRVAVFPLSSDSDERHARFTSIRGQLLNQSPELRDC